VAQRGSRKGFVDIYTILTNHKPLEDLLFLFKKKYETDIEMPVRTGLSYFDDAEKEPALPGWQGDWLELKKYPTSQVRDYSMKAF